MPFSFKLLDPPCDVAFLSLVDGEALYNADNARTRDVKEATIRQIGWHRVQLPQDWFLSQQALETTAHVLEAMQCTVQYLRYRSKNEEKRNIKLTAALQHCEEERAAAFEELIELREHVALYKKQLRDVTQGERKGGSLQYRTHQGPASPANVPTGLPCAFCENVYPSKHALESHFRKRHKRPTGYAAMAAASAAVGQQQQQQQQQQHDQQETAASALPEVVASPTHAALPFMNRSSLPHDAPFPGTATASHPPPPSAAALDSRGTQALREEVSELRLAIAKLLTQQAEFYRGMAPSSLAAVPMPSALTSSPPLVVSRTPPPLPERATATTTTPAGPGSLPSFPPTAVTSEGGDVVLRIPHELLHASPELRLLQSALDRDRTRSTTTDSDTTARSAKDKPRTGSPPPRDLQKQPPPPPQQQQSSPSAARPTLDPRSFLRSSNSDSVLYGVTSAATAAVAGSQRRSMMDSLIEVSPMSPSPSRGHNDSARKTTKQREQQKQQQQHNATVKGQERSVSSGSAATYASHRPHFMGSVLGATNSSLRAPAEPAKMSQLVNGKGSPHASSPHALTALSDYSSLRDDLTMSSNGRPLVGAIQSPLASSYRAVRASADSGRTAQGLDYDSPMVRLPSSSDALTTSGSPVERVSPSANRYAAPSREELSSQRTYTVAPSSPQGGKSTSTDVGVSAPLQPAGPPLATPSPSLAKVDITNSLLSKKNYGPVPSVPMFRDSSSSDSLPPTSTHQSTASIHPSAALHSGTGSEGLGNAGGSGGIRSPTQTPATSRATKVPALNLSSVSLHGSGDRPPRSASPLAHHSHAHRSSTTMPSKNVLGSDGDGVAPVVVKLEGLRASSSSVLQQSSGFAFATPAPTQKTVPVVRLVPAAPSDSAELAQQMDKADGDSSSSSSNASAPSFTNVDVGPGYPQAYEADLPLMKTQPARRPVEVVNASDASYSVEAQPYEEEEEEEEQADELSAGVYEVCRGGSPGSLHNDIAVDEGSRGSSHNPPSSRRGPGSDPVMEDVLTDDNLQQTPLLRTKLAPYSAAPHQPGSADSFLEEVTERQETRTHDADASDGEGEEEEEEEEGNRRVYLSEDALAHLHDTDERSGERRAAATGEKRSARDPVAAAAAAAAAAAGEAEPSVSGDYSYYSYSYSDEDGQGAQDIGSSLEGLEITPPMAASLNTTITAGATAATELKTEEADRQHPQRAQRRREREQASGPPTELGSPAPKAVPNTALSGSEEVASVHQQPAHDESFQSNVSSTMKKAGGVFKSLFKGKKK